MNDISLEEFWKTWGNFEENCWQYPIDIPVEFHQNSAVIAGRCLPLDCYRKSSEIPL